MIIPQVVVDEAGVALGLVYSDDASIRAAVERRKVRVCVCACAYVCVCVCCMCVCVLFLCVCVYTIALMHANVFMWVVMYVCSSIVCHLWLRWPSGLRIAHVLLCL
jgi:hypothetical protein